MENFEELFRILKSQHEIERFTKKYMQTLLDKAELEEDDLLESELELDELEDLQQSNLMYHFVEELPIEYTVIENFKCFKLLVDEVIYTYFIWKQNVNARQRKYHVKDPE